MDNKQQAFAEKQERPQRPKADYLKSFALLFLTLIVIEASLQGLTRLPVNNKLIAALKLHTSYDFDDKDFKWKKIFIEKYDRMPQGTIPISQREYRVDPELGWVPRVNIKLTNKRRGDTYTTNSMGFRSLREYRPDNQRYAVVILGDSFTYGSDADDSEVWPTILQSLNNKFNVMNLAVGGYGTDQMLLMLKRHIMHLEPDLVIAAFVGDDLYRSTLTFRGFQKPKFRIEKGELRLMNTLIRGDVESVATKIKVEIKAKLFFSEVKTFSVVMNVFGLLRAPREGRCGSEETELNDRIFGAMIDLCKEHGADFLFLHLPWGRQLMHGSDKSCGERYFYRFVKINKVNNLNPRKLFLQSGARFSTGHYKKPAANLVANAVNTKINSLPSYRARD